MKFDETERVNYEKFKQYLHDQASAWESTYVIGEIMGQKKEKIQIAIKSLTKGLDTETIAEITGLTIDEIERLRLSQD